MLRLSRIIFMLFMTENLFWHFLKIESLTDINTCRPKQHRRLQHA